MINVVIHRLLMRVLTKGIHRIRHYWPLANGSRADNVVKAHALLNVPKPDAVPGDPKSADVAEPPMLWPDTAPLAIRIDTT
jgi:hypothetical protein